jgi:hypothetical protein
MGIDGSQIDTALLQIPSERFINENLTSPRDMGRRYDLAMSLEVAEHLAPEYAAEFVARLVRLSDMVFFSAAIPGQGGYNHVNEQWPEYWAAHFAQHGYDPIDCIRWQVWDNPEVLIHYAQNVMLFARRDRIVADAPLWHAWRQTHPSQLSLVHPRLYLQKADISFRGAIRRLPHLFWRAVRQRLVRGR